MVPLKGCREMGDSRRRAVPRRVHRVRTQPKDVHSIVESRLAMSDEVEFPTGLPPIGPKLSFGVAFMPAKPSIHR